MSRKTIGIYGHVRTRAESTVTAQRKKLYKQNDIIDTQNSGDDTTYFIEEFSEEVPVEREDY
jgi:hypothetical protein